MDERRTQRVANEDPLLAIGIFARRSRLSSRALRLYERQGLLVPAQVDDSNGYRRYRQSQLTSARLIATLRRLDMPLTEIAAVLGSPPAKAAELVAAHWDAVERRTSSQRELAGYVRAVLAGDGAQVVTYQVRQRQVPEQAFLTAQRHVDITGFQGFVAEATSRLTAVAEQYSARIGEFTFVFHGEVTEDSDGPVEICLPVDPDVARAAQLPARTEPAHREAYVRVTRSQAEYPQILSAYDAVFTWAERHNEQSAGPPREVYLRHFPTAAPHEQVCDVALPVA